MTEGGVRVMKRATFMEFSWFQKSASGIATPGGGAVTAFRKKVLMTLAIFVLVVGQFGCSEINREDSPVELLIAATQILNTVDLFPPENDPPPDCEEDVVTLLFTNRVKRPDVVDARFLDIRLHTERTSYVRMDGGTVVPSPYTRAIGAIIPATGTGSGIGRFQIFEADAISRPPFAALFGSEFGLDPETGRPFVRLTVTHEYFGETLAGDRVSGKVSYPITVCAGCGGCN